MREDREADAESEGRGVLRILLRIVVVLVLLAGGLSAGLVYGNYQLGKERKAHQERINEANKKLAQVQKKSSEERELRSSLESQKRGLAGEVEKLRKENGALAEEMKKTEGATQAFEGKIKELAEEYKRVKASREEAGIQLAKAVEIGKNLEAEVKRLSVGKQTLETSLAKVNQDLDHCRTSNGKLCVLADEILQKHQPKGLGAVLQNEPVTQIKKIELEKFTQEYRDKIDQEKLSRK